ncbi:hypothetical protein QT333_02155 [Escherichia coli]|nr:hypothetical protein [Escherichia coli]
MITMSFHFVKHFGEDYGFTSTENLRRIHRAEKGFKNITQKDVIVEAMNNSDKPLTKPEIANLLKSKSLAHASFYLDDLLSGEVLFKWTTCSTPPACAKKYRHHDYVAALHAFFAFWKASRPSILKHN